MSKRKKTREQKIIADLRRKVQAADVSLSVPKTPSSEPKHQTYSLPTMTASKPLSSVSPLIPLSLSYSTEYLKHDITKTGLLTIGILAGQIILFFFLRLHVLKVPGLMY